MEQELPLAYMEAGEGTPAPQPAMLDPGVAPQPTPAPGVLKLRSEKAQIGVGMALQQNPAETYSSIANGDEENYRNSAASDLNFRQSMRKQQAIMDYVSKTGRALTPDEYAEVINPFLTKDKPADPRDVIERAYAHQYISSANTAADYMQTSVLSDATREMPEQLGRVQEKATELTTKLEFARTLKENVEAEVANQGIVPWAADQVKTMFQPYVEAKMRGINPDVGKLSGGLLLGDNMKAQADNDFMRPLDEFKKILPERIAQLRKDNPTLAAQYLDYVVGISNNQQVLDNVFTMISPLDYASMGKGALGLVRKVDTFNRTNAAFKDLVKSTAKVGDEVTLKAVMEEGAGNNGTAAVTRATDSVVKDLSGTTNPIQDIKEKLTSNFRLDGDLLDSNPGNLSKSQLTILKDGFYNTGERLYDTIMNAVRVNRTPIPLASEQALQAYKEIARSKFPGLDNAILDIGSPTLDKATNTYHIPFTFANHGGDLFSSPEVARDFAKRYGFADARIVSAEGRVEMEAAGFKGSKTDLANKVRLEKSIPVTTKFLKDVQIKMRNLNLTALEKDTAKQQLKDTKDILARDKASLDEINKRVTLGDPVIQQEGLGYKIVIVKPYSEVDEGVRSFLIDETKEGKYAGPGASTSSAEGFNSWKNSILGWIRGADDTLSYNETLQRKVATYTQNLFREWAKDEAKALEEVANQFKFTKPKTWLGAVIGQKQMFKEFNEVLKFGKTPHPVTGEKGWFFKTPGDLNDHYLRNYKRDVTFPETQAYFAHVKLTEGNRVLSEISEYRNRARLGAEQHQISTIATAGKATVNSGFFDGIHQKEFPGGKDQILVMGERLGEERLYHLGANNIPGKDLERYRDQVSKGQAKIIRIYDPDSHPLKDFSEVAGSNRIRYILTYNTDTKPLDLNHVNRRGGGHFDVDAPFYIKQAKMAEEMAGSVANDKRRKMYSTYTGDSTLMPIHNRAMAKDVITKMNEVNKHMAAGDPAAAEAASRGLGIEWKEIEGWYSPSRDHEGKILPPRINANEPFYLVPRNKKIIDLGKELQNRHGDFFRDGTKSGSDAQQFQVAYNQPRDVHDLYTLKDEGSQANPIYKYVPAEYVDPIPTMNRALNRAIQSTFMDDYKIYAVEHWLQEAIPHLKVDADEVRSAPFWHFNNASERGAFTSGTDDATKWNLLSNRYKINQFLGVPNKVDTAIHSLTQMLADGLYQKLGPLETRGIAGKAVEIVPLWALAKVKDPVSAIRSFAFNAKLGLFALPQMLVQAQTYTSIIALEPRRGMAGTYATMLHQWARVNSNPEVLKALDNYASKLNMFGSKWKTGEWIEARNELKKTGFEHVSGEYAMADDAMNAKFIKNSFGNFLDAGQIFFREGEKASRLGAYYTAFREFRDLNPTKVITDVDRAAILNKADLLTTNMSRASASSLHGGVLSLSTQFLSYQLRMAEMFLGKRIGETTTERALARARLLSVYAAMYGAPSALGITGYPFGDSIREAAINRGYVVGDNFINSLVMEGIPAMAIAAISGGGDFRKGTFVNWGDRLGSQGFTTISQSFRSDSTIWKIAGGAGAGVFYNTIMSLDPFWQAAKYMVSDDEEGNTFKVGMADFGNIFNEVSSKDMATRWWMAMNTGKWVSKNEAYIGDTSQAMATFMSITGTKPQAQDDIFSIKNIKDAEEKHQKDAEKDIIKDYRKAVEANANGDPDLSKSLFVRARARMIAAGIPLDRRSEIYANASRGYEKQIDTSVWNWATKNVPAGQEDTRLKALTTKYQMDELKK